MTIFKHARGIILVSAVILGTGGGVAFAAATWTITPGGNITGSSGKITFKDVTTGNTFTCTSTRGSATAKSGSGLTDPLASGTSASASNCIGPVGVAFSLTAGDLPWKINGVSFDAATGVAKGNVSGIHVAVTASGCSAVVDGTSGSGNNGLAKATYNNGTGKSQLLATGGNLHFWDVSGCFGLIKNGDTVTVSATYTVTPKQKVTSP